MTVEQVSLLDASDIKSIMVTCACGVSVRIKIDSSIPQECSSCNKRFSAGSKNAVRAIQDFVAEAKHEGAIEKVQLWV